ncbi:MAG: hypothetical protein H3C64_07110 [Candidatus Kuenenia stuttgartiensis]|nr:hypothetical protein [Candidatus Kuenenia stuttgartiensis]
MCADTRDCSYIFFNNGFVECKAEGYKLLPYTEMSGYIWKGQKIDKVFNSLTTTGQPPAGMFTSFLLNVCNQDKNRLHSLCTIIGYMLHSYYDYKLKAIVLTDSEISDTPNGRTGKTLVLQALKKVKPAAIINGKNFKTDHQFKYQDVNPDTSIVALNDVKRHFNVEDLFNDISDGITVEKKNQKPFTTQAKMIISTNMTLKIEGASANDRFIEFEFSNHYSDTRSPKDDFGKWFFSEWDDTEWNDFYNLMAYCICQFLKHSLVIPESINIQRRRLIDHTNDDFVTWMDEQVSAGQIAPGNEYPKNELYSRFIDAYPDYGEKGKGQITQRAFTTFLKRYINNSGNFAPFKKEDTRRSNGKDMILFRSVTDVSSYTDQPAKHEPVKLPF